MKKTNIIIIASIAIIILGAGIYYFTSLQNNSTVPPDNKITDNTKQASTTDKLATTTPTNKTEIIIGTSVQGRAITAYHYGTGSKEILFIGGIHGGYEWNTVSLAYQAMDYFKANPTSIPSDVKITIIPVLNPDGLNKTVGTDGRFTEADVPKAEADTVSGRFNANNVDLNRNFDCDWQATGKWQSKTVSGGSSAFSEPESLAIKNYIESVDPTAVIVWYSAAGGVYSSSCNGGILAETKNLTSLYAKASGYPAFEKFDSYALSGDMVNWFAKEKIPAISVLLTNHKDTEWTKNLAGIKAILKNYTK